MDSFKSIISLWPSYGDLAKDVTAAGGAPVRYGNVQIWSFRDSIPPEWWRAVIKAAEQRGFSGVTIERLATLRTDRRNVRAADQPATQSSEA